MPNSILLSTELLGTIKHLITQYEQGSLSSPEALIRMLSLLENNETDILEEFEFIKDATV